MTATIIIGNGIGLAIDKNYFELEKGLKKAWDAFSEQDRQIIGLGNGVMPSKEEELENHHLIMSSCQELKRLGENINWLSNDGQKFPDIYQTYIYKVAKHFFDYDLQSPSIYDNFIDNLCEYIKANKGKCHIATLNYDKLLYGTFIEKQIVKGYDGCLVDGIYDSGFAPGNLVRTHNHFGWYLHLHGSPLFYTENGIIKKEHIPNLPDGASDKDKIHAHIVLARTQSKPDLIARSSILNDYFSYFTKALEESNEIYVLGYSGNDEHVNTEIENWTLAKSFDDKISKIDIQIVEWNNPSESDEERNKFWRDKLISEHCGVKANKINVKLTRLDNILTFRFPTSSINKMSQVMSQVCRKFKIFR